MAKEYYYILGLCISIKIVYLLLQIKQQVICCSSFLELGKSFIYCNATIDLLVSGLRSSKFTLLNNVKSFVWFWDFLSQNYIIHNQIIHCWGSKKQGLYYPPTPQKLFKTDDHELGILQCVASKPKNRTIQRNL